jgi:putative lipoic acid-binding regulatory protein
MARIFEGSTDVEQFRRLLDEQYEWPSPYTFKFIVPVQGLEELELLLDGHQLTTRTSRNGNYVSVTLSPIVKSSESVVSLYTEASVIEGLVSL